MKERITSLQLLFLLFITENATTFLFLPSDMAAKGGNDTWLAPIFVPSLYGLAVVFIVVSLARRFPQLTLTEYLPLVLGKGLGKFVALAYTVFFIQINGVIMAEASHFLHIHYLIYTPHPAIEILLMTAALAGAYFGIEAIARHNQMVFPLFIFASLLLFLLILRDIDLKNFQPFLAQGLVPVLKASVLPAAWRGEVVLLAMLLPFLNQPKKALITGAGMVIGGALLNTVSTWAIIGTFSSQVTASLAVPGNNAAQYILVPDVLERSDILIATVWVAAIIVKLTVFLYISKLAVETTLGLKPVPYLVFLVAGVTLLISTFGYHRTFNVINFLEKIWPYEAAIYEFLVPLLILLVALIRRKKEVKEDAV